MPVVKDNKTGSQLRRSTPSFKQGGRAKPTFRLKPEYISGLTDGEGCFYVHIRKSDAYRIGFNVALHFFIKMRADDKILLQKVKETLGCGAVYFQKEKRSNHTDCYRYTVNGNKDILEKIIPFFEKFSLQSQSKLKSFKTFSRIALMIKNNEHLTKKGLDRIVKLKQKMNNHNVGLA